MKNLYQIALRRISEDEQKISFDLNSIIEQSKEMTLILKDWLEQLKQQVLVKGFNSNQEEIDFFKTMKPQIMGKLLFYNKVFRIESRRPCRTGEIYKNYFTDKLQQLESYYREELSKSKFYSYYRSGDRLQDELFFLRGKIDLSSGLKGFVFEADPKFSTYYDYKISKIIECDLLYDYLLLRLEEHSNYRSTFGKSLNDLFQWIDSKNAMIELIYGIYAARSVADNGLGVKRLAKLFEQMFNIELGDLHHAFHRMKYRSGERCIYLQKVKSALERYMDDGLL